MFTKILLILLVLFTTQIHSQELTRVQLDSLYIKFLQLRAPELLPEVYQPEELSLEDRKCGFDLVSQVKVNLNNFSKEQQNILKQQLSRPSLQTSVVSPSGFFRIHYDASNVNGNLPSFVSGWSVEQNVNEVAKALDSSYRFEVDYLGFLQPPTDNGSGGDDKYDVYIVNQAGGFYGYTEWESKVGSINWTSFMVIDNDYVGYYSTGLDGMQVTVAHEFHHGIQIGNYGVSNSNSPYRSSDVFFYELTSTSMEEFVYDSVNDYYAYMDSYFRRTNNSFPNQNGYNLAIWNIYIVENFGFGILIQQWEQIPSRSAIIVINQSLLDLNSSFPKELNQFGIWTFFTGFRKIPGLYFEEAENYPMVTPTTVLNFTPPQQIANMTSQPTANNFVNFIIPSNTDSLVAIITNADAFAANGNPSQPIDFEYTLYSNPSIGNRQLTDVYSSDFNVSNASFWSVSEILNNDLIREDSLILPPSAGISYAYPNPFNYTKSYITGQLIFFPMNANLGDEVDLNIYSVGMQLVFSKQLNIQNLPGDQKGISWNGLDNDSQKLASGVYIYVIKKGDEVITGKVVIFNE